MKKMCAKCGGSMKNGGPVTKIKKKLNPKMEKGGTIYGIPQTGTTNYSAPTMKKGGAVKKVKKMAKGGSAFGMLSVKAGVDKNPKATAADRIAGAKMNKKKMGGTTKKK